MSIEVQTKRLKLTPCTEESIKEYYTKEYELGPHIGMFLKNLKEDPSFLGWGVWLVVDKQTNKIIGDIGFKGRPDHEMTVEVGYGITASEQNKGYATEALNCIVKWAFSYNSVNRIIAECLEDNIPSIKVLEKLNMTNTHKDNNMLYWQLVK